eukprot:gene3320-4179_t
MKVSHEEDYLVRCFGVSMKEIKLRNKSLAVGTEVLLRRLRSGCIFQSVNVGVGKSSKGELSSQHVKAGLQLAYREATSDYIAAELTGTPDLDETDELNIDEDEGSMLVKEVCKAAKAKLPWLKKRVVQIDGAGPHQGAFNEVVKNKKRLGALVERQPAQMPDGNRNDLLVYPAMQRQVDKLCEGERKHIDTVVTAVHQA